MRDKIKSRKRRVERRINDFWFGVSLVNAFLVAAGFGLLGYSAVTGDLFIAIGGMIILTICFLVKLTEVDRRTHGSDDYDIKMYDGKP